MTEVKITEQNLESGLRGIPVGYCPTSMVDPEKGLFYSGMPITELAHKDPEEVIYLLMNQKMPSDEELEEFKTLLRENAILHPGVIEGLKGLPHSGHPMKWMKVGLLLMSIYNGVTTYQQDAIRVIAQLPELVAAIFRIRNDWGDPIPPKPELGYMENFTHMLGCPTQCENMVELMRVFNILHYDHGGGNLSTFVGKAVASGLEDTYGSLVGAMSALAGPRHGLANQESLRFLKRTLQKVGDPANEEAVGNYVDHLLTSGDKLYGYGHAVLRVEDPRATVQFDLGEKICPKDPLFRLAQTMRKVAPPQLMKLGKVSDPYPNVDAVSGALLNSCGLKDESYYTVLFGLSRCVGISAQIVYEREKARDGKGTPIMRPKYIYSGPSFAVTAFEGED